MYFGTSVLLLSLSTALTVVVLNLHYRGQLGRAPPRWVRGLVLRCLGSALGLRGTIDSNLEVRSGSRPKVSSPRSDPGFLL